MSRRVGGRISVVHSTLNTPVSSGGELLCDVSTIWSVERNQDKRWIGVVLWCVASLNGTHRCNRLACLCGVLL